MYDHMEKGEMQTWRRSVFSLRSSHDGEFTLRFSRQGECSSYGFGMKVNV
jgi:hypothetical protein